MTTRVEITEEQLPEQLRPLLVAHLDARRAAGDAHNDVRVAGIREKHLMQGPLDEANRKAAEAHVALLEATREQPGAMREYAHARFAASVERAREHLAAAEQELRSAAGFAAVHGSVRDGRPCVNPERGHEAPGKKRALFSVGLVQDAAGSLPDAID
jgi:hypothetical protein